MQLGQRVERYCGERRQSHEVGSSCSVKSPSSRSEAWNKPRFAPSHPFSGTANHPRIGGWRSTSSVVDGGHGVWAVEPVADVVVRGLPDGEPEHDARLQLVIAPSEVLELPGPELSM